MNPLLLREARSRFRDKRSFGLLFCFAALVSALVFRGIEQQLTGARTDFWPQLVWMHTLGLLLLSPAWSAGSLASERESGLLEGLQLSALSPREIAWGKALSSFAFAFWLLGCFLPPLLTLAYWLGIPASQLFIFAFWQWVVMLLGTSLGLACSAWARTSQYAFRSAFSLLMAWQIGSFASAFAAGETAMAPPAGTVAPEILRFWGRTNPVYGALDATFGNPFETRWPLALGFCVLATALALWAAVVGAGRVFQSPIRNPSLPAKGTRNEFWIARFIRPQNPILGRELRLIFRFPPLPKLAVLIQTAIAIPVALLYGLMIVLSFTNPPSRPTIFWGVALTLLVVSGMAAALLGASALARERESQTWDALELSLLGAREILWGKVGAALGACLVLSFAAWPLLLFCVRPTFWGVPQSAPTDVILPFQLLAFVLIWLGTLARAFAIGLFWGWKTGTINQAAGLTLAIELFLALAGPIALGVAPQNPFFLGVSGLTNPLVVSLMAGAVTPQVAVWATGLPFFAVQMLIFLGVWRNLEQKIYARHRQI